MTKKKDIPHLTEWKVIREEFTDHWRALGETYLHSVQPLMEVTRMHTINGTPHVVSVLEWGNPVRFHPSNESGHVLLHQNLFLLETLWRAQKQAAQVLPTPKCRPSISITEEAERQKAKQHP